MKSRYLVAFDFDNTLTDGGTSTQMQTLLPDEKVSENIKEMLRNENWIDYIVAICQLLHSEGITPAMVRDSLKQVKLLPGMMDLLNFLKSSADHGFEVCFDNIIISDANSEIITCILDHLGYSDCFTEIFTNPAHFDEKGCMQVGFYHTQNWCSLSPENMCKGHVMEAFINKQKGKGVTYDGIAYVGDGTNDLCPALRLTEKDLLLARSGFRLADLVSKYQGNEEEPLHANVHHWSTGVDVKNVLIKQFCS